MAAERVNDLRAFKGFIEEKLSDRGGYAKNPLMEFHEAQ